MGATNSSTLPQQEHMPLRGVRILDMATVLAAPFSATLCADMGAEVLKLELPQGGDPLRGLSPVHEGQPLFWKTANRGKKGISLDVRRPEGRALFLRLLPEVDVLVENFRTGTLDGWGLDIATLHAANPRLIVLRLTGFGQTGPYARRPGFARIFEAMSGFTQLTGEPDGPPQHMNFPLGDMVAGLFGAFAISTALAERNALPPGQQRGAEIDLSATEAMMRLLDPLAAEHQIGGVVRTRTGSRATYTAPSNVYRAADGVWFTLVGTGTPIFARICRAMGQEALAHDARFADSAARIRHLEALDAIIAGWCACRPFEALAQDLEREQVPFSRVYSIADLRADPHMRARGAFVDLPDPQFGQVPAPTAVPRFAGRRFVPPDTGPATGQHNAQVYGALGLDAAALASLRETGVI
ncbi:CoA transferase [Xenophilus arseniciresistens]|uniref:CoA transferase n=1 Tax=Xenophilus arseniciresistens TaxID=1283306 RepID=A0AAE3N356_9BURK|nr:CoA transferase [Xenophilus arseniciresistens]MDA7414930.1 CoA transferase [Xenophilus arseniciresistens]